MTEAAPIVRRLDPTELDVAAALHVLCFEEAWDRESLHGLLTAPGGFGCLAVDAVSGHPGGFVLGRIAAKECEILSVGVVPAIRQRGWAANLIRGLITEARQSGAESVVLEVAEDNVAAIALYRAFDFVVVGRRLAYYRRADSSVDAHIMRLTLDSGGATSQNIHDQSVD